MRWLPVLLVLAACKPVPECENNAQCADLEACIEQQCEPVECLTSTQCAMEYYCAQDTYVCTFGCEFSDDCYTADRCEPSTNICVPRKCDDTQRDCDVGERCDVSTGECYLDPAPHCKTCSSASECGTTGQCWNFGMGSYCFLECNPEAVETCPAGFQCTLVNNSYYYCVAFCPMFE
ncbi:MAG: hypothetical protein JRJ84_13625 [Deltaproteobacteria bacterium]|nr:hypothetical protein [Deltaproteobacteria bacterium]